jgi:hypothetical protein
MARIDPNAPIAERRREVELRTVTRNLLFATVDSIGERRSMIDICAFVGRLAGTGRDMAANMWGWALVDHNIEHDIQNERVRLAEEDMDARTAAALDPIPLAYGRTMVRAALDLLVEDQLSIDEQQRSLNEKLDEYHTVRGDIQADELDEQPRLG